LRAGLAGLRPGVDCTGREQSGENRHGAYIQPPRTSPVLSNRQDS
jgi:hypothetical protein